jgi:branched-subunit amino acid transport protein
LVLLQNHSIEQHIAVAELVSEILSGELSCLTHSLVVDLIVGLEAPPNPKIDLDVD